MMESFGGGSSPVNKDPIKDVYEKDTDQQEGDLSYAEQLKKALQETHRLVDEKAEEYKERINKQVESAIKKEKERDIESTTFGSGFEFSQKAFDHAFEASPNGLLEYSLHDLDFLDEEVLAAADIEDFNLQEMKFFADKQNSGTVLIRDPQGRHMLITSKEYTDGVRRMEFEDQYLAHAMIQGKGKVEKTKEEEDPIIEEIEKQEESIQYENPEINKELKQERLDTYIRFRRLLEKVRKSSIPEEDKARLEDELQPVFLELLEIKGEILEEGEHIDSEAAHERVEEVNESFSSYEEKINKELDVLSPENELGLKESLTSVLDEMENPVEIDPELQKEIEKIKERGFEVTKGLLFPKDKEALFTSEQKEDEKQSIVTEKLRQFGMSEKNMEDIAGWTYLSSAEKAYVLEKLRQSALADVEALTDEAVEDEIRKKQAGWKGGINIKVTKKIKGRVDFASIDKFITGARVKWFGGRNINRRKVLDSLSKAGIDRYQDDLERLVTDQISGKGPEVFFDEDGNVLENYLSNKKEGDLFKEAGIDDKLIEDFNKSAREMANMPIWWGYESSRGSITRRAKEYLATFMGEHTDRFDNKNRLEQYQNISNAFLSNKRALLDTIETKLADSETSEEQKIILRRSLGRIYEAQSNITLDQVSVIDPTAGQSFSELSQRTVQLGIGEPGGTPRNPAMFTKSDGGSAAAWMAAGFGARTAVRGFGGAFAVPIVAAALGGVRGYVKAKEDIRTESMRRRELGRDEISRIDKIIALKPKEQEAEIYAIYSSLKERSIPSKSEKSGEKSVEGEDEKELLPELTKNEKGKYNIKDIQEVLDEFGHLLPENVVAKTEKLLETIKRTEGFFAMFDRANMRKRIEMRNSHLGAINAERQVKLIEKLCEEAVKAEDKGDLVGALVAYQKADLRMQLLGDAVNDGRIEHSQKTGTPTDNIEKLELLERGLKNRRLVSEKKQEYQYLMDFANELGDIKGKSVEEIRSELSENTVLYNMVLELGDDNEERSKALLELKKISRFKHIADLRMSTEKKEKLKEGYETVIVRGEDGEPDKIEKVEGTEQSRGKYIWREVRKKMAIAGVFSFLGGLLAGGEDVADASTGAGSAVGAALTDNTELPDDLEISDETREALEKLATKEVAPEGTHEIIDNTYVEPKPAPDLEGGIEEVKEDESLLDQIRKKPLSPDDTHETIDTSDDPVPFRPEPDTEGLEDAEVTPEDIADIPEADPVSPSPKEAPAEPAPSNTYTESLWSRDQIDHVWRTIKQNLSEHDGWNTLSESQQNYAIDIYKDLVETGGVPAGLDEGEFDIEKLFTEENLEKVLHQMENSPGDMKGHKMTEENIEAIRRMFIDETEASGILRESISDSAEAASDTTFMENSADVVNTGGVAPEPSEVPLNESGNPLSAEDMGRVSEGVGEATQTSAPQEQPLPRGYRSMYEREVLQPGVESTPSAPPAEDFAKYVGGGPISNEFAYEARQLLNPDDLGLMQNLSEGDIFSMQQEFSQIDGPESAKTYLEDHMSAWMNEYEHYLPGEENAHMMVRPNDREAFTAFNRFFLEQINELGDHFFNGTEELTLLVDGEPMEMSFNDIGETIERGLLYGEEAPEYSFDDALYREPDPKELWNDEEIVWENPYEEQQNVSRRRPSRMKRIANWYSDRYHSNQDGNYVPRKQYRFTQRSGSGVFRGGNSGYYGSRR
jgi:hypothetical protein